MNSTRRSVLSGLAAVPFVGCLDDGRSPVEDGGGDSSENGSVEGNDAGNGTLDLDEDEEYALIDRDAVFYSVAAGETGVELLRSPDEAAAAVDDAAGTDANGETLEAFVDATDFDRATLLLIRARVPDPCHAIELEGVDADEDGLRVRARTIDESDPGEVCPQQVRVLTAAVRAVFEDAVPEGGSVSIVDADGDEREFRYGG